MNDLILLSCGEASGDAYAGELVRELRRLRPDIGCFGLGGERLAAAGAELVVHLDEVSVIGLVEVLGRLPALRRSMDRLVEEASRRKPSLAVLIDFSGFNLRLAGKLQRLGTPIVYYVSPQVWAWRRGRVKTIRSTAKKMLVILPFEEAFYRAEGVPVRFVGHPLVDLVRSRQDRATFCKAQHFDPARPILAVLPGSRRREIELHMPIVVKALERIAAKRPDLQFAVLKAPTIERSLLAEAAGLGALGARIVEGATYEGLAHAAAAIVASGTATVEAALAGAPMVVVYRVGKLSYALGKPFVRVPHYAMVNLIAGKEIVPELIQNRMSVEAVANAVLRLLERPEEAEAMRRELAEVRRRLGEGGASRRAAEEVVAVLAACKKDHHRQGERAG